MSTDELRLLIITGALLLATVAAARRLNHLFRSAGARGIGQFEDADSAITHAEEYLGRHHLAEAMLCARQAVKLAPHDPDTHVCMARVHRARGNGAKAKRSEQRARELGAGSR